MSQNNYIVFFRSEINQELLIGTEERIDILRKIPDMQVLKKLEGIDFFMEWENLFDAISICWKRDIENNAPFLKWKLVFWIRLLPIWILLLNSFYIMVLKLTMII